MAQEYISVGELSAGFSENILAPTGTLIGRRVELYYESGKKAAITFTNAESLTWETKGKGRTEKSVYPYAAIMPRKDIFFVDFVPSDRSVSIVLDMRKRIATLVTGILPTAEAVMIPLIVRAKKGIPLTSVQALFEHASVDRPFTKRTVRHKRSADLVGERIQWIYSSKDAYEHIYLTENTYTWHCISGSEKGLADTDRCFFYKIGKKFYLFVWIEKIIPTVGVVLEDLDVMRSYGKLFGRKGFDMNGPMTNFAVGSYGKWLNRTEYDLSRIRNSVTRRAGDAETRR